MGFNSAFKGLNIRIDNVKLNINEMVYNGMNWM